MISQCVNIYDKWVSIALIMLEYDIKCVINNGCNGKHTNIRFMY